MPRRPSVARRLPPLARRCRSWLGSGLVAAVSTLRLRRHTPFAPGRAGLLAGELVGLARAMGREPSQARELANLLGRHRGEAAARLLGAPCCPPIQRLLLCCALLVVHGISVSRPHARPMPWCRLRVARGCLRRAREFAN